MLHKTLTDISLKALKAAPKGKRYTVWDSVLPNFGVRVTDNGVKTFIIMKRLYGKLTRWKLETYPALTLDKARDLAKEYLEDISKGHDPKEKLKARNRAEEEKRRNTFGGVAEDFLSKYVSTLRQAHEEERAIRKEYISRWGKLPITKITRQDVLDVLNIFIAQGKRHQAYRLLGYIRKMYNWAIATNIYGIESSPCDRIKPRDLIGKLAPRKRVLSDEEIRIIWKATKELGHPFGTLYQLLFLTGQRLDEVAGMRRSEINRNMRLWIIPAERIKADANHIVPLVQKVFDIIENIPQGNEGDYVLSTTEGRRPISGFSKAKKELDQIIKKMMNPDEDIPEEDQKSMPAWRVHDIRRTMRTHLSALPVEDIVRELVIGHTQKGLHKVYDQYSYAEEKKEALTLWTIRLSNILEAKEPATVLPPVESKFIEIKRPTHTSYTIQ